MHSLSSLEIYARMFSAALFSVQPYHPATKYMQTVFGGGGGGGGGKVVGLFWIPYSA
jgi:hypothetical protein